MPHVGTDGSPLLERLMFAFDGTLYRPVKCDTNGNLVAAVLAGQTITVEQALAANLLATVTVAAGQTIAVTQAAAANLLATVNVATDQNIQARRYGYYGDAWVKSPVPLGVTATWELHPSNMDLPAGSTTLAFTATPAGTIRVATSVAFRTGSAAATRVIWGSYIAGTATYHGQVTTPANGVFYQLGLTVYMVPGDYLQLTIEGAALHDTLRGYASGYQYSVA